MVTQSRALKTDPTLEYDAGRIERVLRQYRSGLTVGQIIAHTGLTDIRIKLILRDGSSRFAKRGTAFVLAPPPAAVPG